MRYSGGKHIQGKRWAKTMSGYGERWVEPFAGGLGAYVAIGARYDRALLSDTSPIMQMWQALKDGWTPTTEPITRERYYEVEALTHAGTANPQELYEAFAGSFSAQVQSYGMTGIIANALTNTLRKQRALQAHGDRVEIHQRDYRLTVAECGKNDVVYLDPPYGEEKDTQMRWVNAPRGFDFYEMLALAEEAADRGAVAFISCYGRPITQVGEQRWVEVNTHQDAAVNRPGQEARTSLEYLYINAEAQRA